MTSLSKMKTIHYIGIEVSKKTLQIDATDLAPPCPNQAKAPMVNAPASITYPPALLASSSRRLLVFWYLRLLAPTSLPSPP